MRSAPIGMARANVETAGNDVLIRGAQMGDVDAVRACVEAAYAPYVSLIGRKPAPMVADFASLIAAGVVHVALDTGGDVLGFVVFFPKADHMVLENIAVQPKAAGRGVGKALLACCEDTARKAGLARVTLYTNEKMVANLKIYPHLGYRETGRRCEDGFHRVYFEKTL